MVAIACLMAMIVMPGAFRIGCTYRSDKSNIVFLQYSVLLSKIGGPAKHRLNVSNASGKIYHCKARYFLYTVSKLWLFAPDA